MLHGNSYQPKNDKRQPDLYFILCNFRVAAFNDKSPNKLVMKIEASFCTSYVEKSRPDVTYFMDDSDDEISSYLSVCRIFYDD